MLLGTTIHPDMIDKNLRIQINYFILCKADAQQLHYKIFDVQGQSIKNLNFIKSPELFKHTNFDTTEIPMTFTSI